MIDQTILYQAFLLAEPEGLVIRYVAWFSHKETPCFYMCTENRYFLEGQKLKRISKGSGRFAHKTKEEALEHLRYRKRRQQGHLRRQLAFNTAFLDGEIGPSDIVLGTECLVREYLNFDC